MKKIMSRILSLVLAVVSIATVMVSAPIVNAAAATSVKLDTSSYTFTEIGKSYIFLATINLGSGKNIICNSNNSAIATIQPVSHNATGYYYRIISKGFGGTKINVSVNGVTKSIPVYVTNGIDMKTRIGAPTSFRFSVNSADGITLYWDAPNLTTKPVKYYTVDLYTYNAVGDPAYDEINRQCKFSLKMVGITNPGQNFLIYDLFSYNPLCAKIAIGNITIEYMDGTIEHGSYPYSTTTNENGWDN